MRKYLIVVGCWLTILMLVSCSVSNINQSEDDSATVATATVLNEAIFPSPTITSVGIEETNTAIPMLPTETATLQPTAAEDKPTGTPTPVANATFDVAYSELTVELATQNLIDLLATNRDCMLPCWWGIRLGETDVNEIESTFVPLGFDWYRDFEELDDNTPYKASIYIASEEGFVQSIQVRGGAGEETYDRNEAWRPYAIPQVLAQYGVPEEIYVYYPFRFDPGGLQAYRLFLYYPDLGVEIDYLGKATLIDDRDGWAQACPNILETDEINLFLFQPGTVPDYLELTLPESSLPLPELPEGTKPYDLISWVQAAESSLDEFDQLFTELEEGTACFEFKTYWTGNS